MAANVSLRNVAKHFGAVKVVDNISLEIEPGEFVVLVGPSGCGKSTTLRLVAGLEQISDGTISIDNRVEQPRPQGSRRGDGVPELCPLSPPHGARQHLLRAAPRAHVEGGHRR